jgi:TP901 family phage tail tape measure protein
MSDRISTFTIGIDGDVTDIRSLLSSIKSDFRSAVADIQATTKKIDLFENAQADAAKAKQALNEAAAAVQFYANQVAEAKKAGTGVSDELAKSLKDATSAATAAQRAFDRSQSTVTRLGAQLAKAGVDTRSLATEQIRLATALRQASDAAALNSAKQQLGIKTIADVQPVIDKIRASYLTLANSGTLTNTQLAAAWLKQRAAIAEVQGSVTGFRDVLTQVRVPALAVVAALAGLGTAVGSVVSKYNAFNDSVTKGAAITNVSKEQLETLAQGARDVAREFGEDAQTAINATFQLIRSGIPPDNAIEALRVSAQAAQGGLADLGTTAQLGASILQAYGLNAEALPKVFDQIAFASKQGGASIDQLAANIGSLLPVASAAGVPLDELLASIEVLQKAGLDTGQSVATLKRLIAGFADPEVVARLADLGVRVEGLVGTLEQIGKLDPNLTSLRTLIPDAKSLSGVAALTKGYEGLGDALDGIRTKYEGVSAGQAKVVDETAGDKVRKLAAAWEDLEKILGKLAANPAIIGFLTKVVAGIDNFATKIDAAKAKVDEYTASQSTLTILLKTYGDILVLLYRQLGGAVPAQEAFNKALDDAAAGATDSAGRVQKALGVIANAVAEQLAKAKAAAAAAANDVGTAARTLAQDVTAVQNAMAASLKSIEQGSKDAIAALGLQALTEQQVEDATTAIVAKAAADRVAVLKDSSTQILAAFDAEAQARLALVADSADKTKALEVQLTGERKALIQSFVDAYRKSVDDLTAQETTLVQKLKSIDEQRITFNENIEARIAAVRNRGLSSYQQYANTVDQIESLIQRAREANAQSQFDSAQKYITQALRLSDTLATSVTENGREIVSATRAQVTQEGLLTQARDIYNKALDGSKGKTLANKGALDDELGAAKKGLSEQQGILDGIAAKYQKGLSVKIDADITAANTALEILRSAIEDTNRIYHVQLDLQAAQKTIDDLKDNLQKGITAGAQQGVTDAIALLKSLEDDTHDPKIKFLLTDATKQIDDLGSQIKHLEDVKAKPQVEVVTKGVPEAKKQLDDLLLPTNRTVNVTVNVKAVGDVGALTGSSSGVDVSAPIGLRRGGLVPALRRLQHFARGGSVFGGGKIPGIGDQDTVPAMLQSGQFVLRKAASKFYGDSLIGRLARGAAWLQRFATGGAVQGRGLAAFGAYDSPQNWSQYDSSQYIGGNPGDKSAYVAMDTGIGIPPPTLPDDPAARAALLARYITDVVPAARQSDGSYWESAIKFMFGQYDTWQKRPTDANFGFVLDTARAIGLNLGITRGMHTGFDIDGRKWHDEGQVHGADTFGLGSLGHKFDFYRKGGDVGTDTVPAMLTPGEWVINRGAVSKYGSSLMRALNSMSISRESLSRMLAPPPVVHRFAAGGQVPGPNLSSTVAGVRESTSVNTTLNFNWSVADVFSEVNVRRHLLPVLNTIARRSR